MEILTASYGGKAEHSILSVDARIDDDLLILTATEQDYNDYNVTTLQGERAITKEFAISNKNFDKSFLFRCIRDLLLENNITIYMFTEDDIRY